MPINSVHPTYKKQTDDWETMRDSLEGDRGIRANIRKYLPPPPGMDLNGVNDINDILGMAGRGIQSRYNHYTTFAEWPEIVQMSLNGVQGLIHEKPPTVELPTELEYLIDTATPSGDTLQELWETVTREIFSTGRIGLLAEIFADQTYVCPYTAESVINWHVKPKLMGGGATMTVLKEVKSMPTDEDQFEHENITMYRELSLLEFVKGEDGELIELAEPIYRVRMWKQPENKDPEIVINDDTDEDGWIVPEFFGTIWNEIPLTVANTNQRSFRFGPLPLISAARRAISIFRKTADYFRSLYNKGDPQAYVFGVDKEDAPKSIGGSSIWVFPEAEGSAGYLDVEGDGIPHQRDAIKDQYQHFSEEIGHLINGGGEEGVKSGEALRREGASQQVSMKSVVINAGAAVQAQLRLMAKLSGKDEAAQEKIIFSPNLDFAEPLMSGKDFTDYVAAKVAGGPLSLNTLHDLARRHKITDKEFEDEMAEIDAEGPTDAEIQRELDNELALEEAKNKDPDADDDDDDAKKKKDAEGDDGAK